MTLRHLTVPCLVVLAACARAATPSVSPPAQPTEVPPSATAPSPSPRPVPPGEQSQPLAAPLPHVRMRPSTTVGPLVSDAIHPVLLRDLATFRRCYQVALVARPALAGAITLRFTIEAGGRTSDATAETDPGLEDVGACVRETVLHERYPVEPADTRVELPMSMALPDAR